MPMKKVVVLTTGGTLAMAPEGDRVVLPQAELDLLAQVPELEQIASLEQVSLFHVDSAELRPSAWLTLAREIHTALSRADGVVVIHGTDTMAYGASLVAFLLGPLPKPVVFTGAQKPLSDVRSDARQNLVDATLVATMDVPEVALVFGAHAFRGVRATKVDAFGFQAFASPNAPPLVLFGTGISRAEQVRAPSALSPFDPRLDERVAHVRLTPNLAPAYVAALLETDVRILVLEAYGAGTLPSALLPVLREARDRGVVVLAVSQCLCGLVDLRRYEAGQRALDAGVIAGADMTAEAALGKSMVALARCKGDLGALRAALARDWLGESSAR